MRNFIINNFIMIKRFAYILIFGAVVILVPTVRSIISSKTTETALEITTPDNTPTPRPISTPRPTPSPVPTEDLTGKAVSRLTGLYIDEETARKRPMAVVINNMHKALPQSGIGQADVYYEVLAEGDITRIVAIFQDFDSAKIGPVRSARHYFLDFALDFDAVFVHHGGSPQGYNAIKNMGIDNLDGMSLEGTVFFRDKERFSIPGMYEHSSYTSAADMHDGIEKKEYRSELLDDAAGFHFLAETAGFAGGEEALKITVPFSNNYKSIFEYDDENKVYLKYQGTEKHIDEETNEQLSVTNILIRNTGMYIISGDSEGRREVNAVGSGDGYLISCGQIVPVKWEKESHKSPTLWYFADGSDIRLNKGKTWICVFQDGADIEIEGAEAKDIEAGDIES